MYEITEKPEPTFVVNGHTLYFKEDVKYQIIDMSGRIIKTGKENTVILSQPGIYLINTGTQTHKIHIYPSD